ncbi:MAG: hypothetical protein R3F31_04390 [Verrucomicrobiales bacterium]
MDWLTGDGVSLGGYLFPHLHAFGVFGGSTGDSEFLANGHHDPQGDATLQALEPGASLRVGDHLQGFATYSANTDGEGHFDGAWEEAFLKLVDLPFDLELRGGLFLNRFRVSKRPSQPWLVVCRSEPREWPPPAGRGVGDDRRRGDVESPDSVDLGAFGFGRRASQRP